MKKNILAIVFLITTFQLYAQEQKIVGGEKIDISDAPYQVSIEFYEKHFCGGVIINNCWILTAAHCFSDHKPEDLENLMVHAGSTDQTIDSIGQRVAIDQVIRHDYFEEFYNIDGVTMAVRNDLALLHLTTPLEFNNNVAPIKYATPDNTNPEDIAPGIKAFITGWGSTANMNEPSHPKILRGVRIPIISNADAENLLLAHNNLLPPIDNTMISFFEEGVGAARGDSGGPAVIGSGKDAILVGITSWGVSPGGVLPSIYANVRNLSTWIDETIGSKSACSCFEEKIVNFHFEDENGNEQNEFCFGEDVWIDGEATSNNSDNFFMDLWTVNDNGDYIWISSAGWTPGSPDFVNITKKFENDPEHPVTFKAGVTYALKLAIVERDCRWIERYKTFTIKDCCHLISAPTNLQRDGSTLSWDPVPRAVSYIIESVPPFSFSDNCNCKYPISIKQIETKDTSTTLPSILIDNCTLIQVRAVCSYGTISEPSKPICIIGKKILQKAFVTPNPTKGDITFNVLTNDKIKINIEVHNIYGKLVKSFILNTSPEKMNSISWNESNLKSGIYIVTFKANNEVLEKKIIVE